MYIFYITLLLTFVFSLLSRKLGRKNKYIEWTFIILTILTFIIVAGLRENIGDTLVYVQQYIDLADFTEISGDKDKGFTVFILILYQISTDPQFMIFITALITQLGNIIGMSKYRSYFELQIYMYITSGYFLVTLNGIRQSMVGALLFLCTNFIVNGKFIHYLIMVLIMSTIHGSAFIMIPVYFIVRQKAWSKNTIVVIGLSTIFFLFFYQLIPIILDLIGNSTYKQYEEELLNPGRGASFIRVLVNSIPVILSYVYRNKIEEIWPKSNIFINMSLLNLIVMIFSLYNWIFARFSIYFQLYNFILLPFLIKNCFNNRKERDLIYYLFLVCYFIFFYREQVIGGVGLGYRSKFF